MLWLEMKYLPNILTLSRMAFALIYPFSHDSFKLPIIGLALITEYFDGFLSRKFHWSSQLGQLLDPVADKMFFTAVILTLLWEGQVSLWQIFFLSIREVVVLLGTLYVVIKSQSFVPLFKMVPSLLGKTVTALHYVNFLMLHLFDKVSSLLIVLIFILGVLASMNYVKRFLKK